MKKVIFLVLISLSLIANANDKNKIDYDFIVRVSTDRQGEYLIRYYQTLDSFCLGHLDSIAFDKSNKNYTDWVILNTKPLCHLYDKEVATGYTDAHVEKVAFEEGLVRLFISYTYLRGPYGEFKTECTVKVSDGEFGDLVCEEGKRADE